MRPWPPEGALLDAPENRQATSSPIALAEAAARRRVLEAKAVKCGKDRALFVDLGCMAGVIERDEGALGVKEGETRDVALLTRVGRPVQFVVTGFRTGPNGERIAICARRLAQRACVDTYLDSLVPGDAVPAVVTHSERFGAFCDVGAGVCALLPVDCISVSRIRHPAERLIPGQKIRTLLKSRDALGRLTLTMKELLGTWDENAALIEAGETVTGIVRGVEPYGVFVELTPNLAGLAEARSDCVPGQGCVAYIKSVNPEKMKIKLSIVSLSDAPAPRTPLRYFSDAPHVDRFVYSPAECERVVETVF